MKIVSIVGARPQFIKAAAFSRKLRELTDWSELIIHTGQHFDDNMSDVFFREMDIPHPHYNLNIHSMDRGAMIGQMWGAIEEILLQEKPDLVLVYGDTNSTLAGALAAKKAEIKLAHVEAGLRSFNEDMPEENNRVQTDRASDFLFVPASNAIENLQRENIGANGAKIFEVGDIMYDAILFYSEKCAGKETIAERYTDIPYVLCTIHRQENTNNTERLKELFETIDGIAEQMRVVIPMHPRTTKAMKDLGLSTKAELIEPVGYFDMIDLVKKSKLVMTDSGGLQKEAFYLGKFCITLRNETEWIELVKLGANQVCGSDPAKIKAAFNDFQSRSFNFSETPYGTGDTAEKIINTLRQEFALTT